MAWLSEEVTFFSTNIFFTCTLGRILSTSLGAKRGSSTGRYFPGEDGSRAGNGDRVMGMPPGNTCHHKFNSDMIHSITTGIQKNIGDLLENLDKAMDKYNATYSIGSKSTSSVSRKRKENRKKSEHRKKT